MPIALDLDDVATRLTGVEATRALSDPAAWAYALRDAVALARPDVLIVGWGAGFELAALRDVVEGADAGSVTDALYDAPGPLRARPPAQALSTLVATLAGLFPGGPSVALAVLGPSTIAGTLAGPQDDGAELADLCADQLVDLLSACVEAGARSVLLREPHPIPEVDATAARSPIERVLAHQQVDLVVLANELEAQSVELMAPGVWLSEDETFAREMSSVRAFAAAGTLVVGDGPVPGAVDLTRFQL